VNSCHQTFSNAPVVVDNLCDGSKTIGCARSVGDDGLVLLVVLVVHTVNVDGSVILGRSRHNDSLGTILDVKLSLLLSEVSTSAVSNVLAACVTPLEERCIFLLENLDLLSINLNATWDFLDGTFKATYKMN